MFNAIRLRSLLFTTAGTMLFVLFCASILGFFALQQVSNAAFRMGQGKDVVADILPPPLYIIEAHLTAHELLRAERREQTPLLEKLKQLRRDYDARNAVWQQSELDETVRAHLLGEQKAQADRYWQILDQEFVPALGRGDGEGAESAFGKLRQTYLAHRQGVDATVAVASEFANGTFAALETDANRHAILIVAIGLLGVGISAFAIATLLTQVGRRIGGEPAVAMSIASRIAGGDLSASGNDLAGRPGILGALETMRQRLQSLVANVSRNGTALADAAPRVLDRARGAEQNAERQASSAAQIAAAIEELSTSISQAAENAQTANRDVAHAGSQASRSNALVQAAVGQMRDVADNLGQTVVKVLELDKQSSEIGRIVQVIREIAEQTNLLALNAAIEAARAGESGRGFAVVADEVRKLAERTSLSTSEIAGMIDQIQSGMQTVSSGIEGVAACAKEAAGTGESAVTAMGEIDRSVSAALASVSDVASALAEQSAAAAQVAQTVEGIADSAEGTLQGARADAAEARSLVQLSESLFQLTHQFRC